MADHSKSYKIKCLLQKKHQDMGDYFLTEVKNGPSYYRDKLLIMDAVAIKKSWEKSLVTAYEVKISRSDFTRDEKWHGYLNYSNKFSFVCPDGMISKDELDPCIGLVYWNEDKGTLKTVRHAVMRNIDIPKEFYMYIIFSKLDPERLPFFRERKGYFEQWLAEKRETEHLAIHVKNRLIERLAQSERDRNKATSELNTLKYLYNEVEKAKEILKKHNIVGYYSSDWVDRLENYLNDSGNNKTDKNVDFAINRIESALSYLRNTR